MNLDDNMREFLNTVYSELDDLFSEGELQVLTSRGEDGSPDSIVRVVNQNTGVSIDMNEYESQLQNAIVAKVRLLKASKSS